MTSKNSKIPVILDVDTGIDDLVAMAIALASKKLDVLLVTTCGGNAGVEQATKNSLDVLHLYKHDEVPVAKGEENAYIGTVREHGEDGLGGSSRYMPKHDNKPLAVPAHEAMAEAIRKSDKKVTIITIGPLSNVAKLITKHKDVLDKIGKLIIMAGSIETYKPGELPYFGFNVKIDPKACEVVINSGLDILVNPCDMGHIAKLDWYDVYKTKYTNMAGKIFEEIFRQYKDHHVKDGIAMHDSCAVASAIDPSLFKIEKLYVHMEYYNGLGVLRCEWKEPRNINVCTSVDVEGIKKLYFKSLKRTKTVLD